MVSTLSGENFNLNRDLASDLARLEEALIESVGLALTLGPHTRSPNPQQSQSSQDPQPRCSVWAKPSDIAFTCRKFL